MVAIEERLTDEAQGFSYARRAVTGGLSVVVFAFVLQQSSTRQFALGVRMFHPSQQECPSSTKMKTKIS